MFFGLCRLLGDLELWHLIAAEAFLFEFLSGLLLVDQDVGAALISSEFGDPQVAVIARARRNFLKEALLRDVGSFVNVEEG